MGCSTPTHRGTSADALARRRVKRAKARRAKGLPERKKRKK